MSIHMMGLEILESMDTEEGGRASNRRCTWQHAMPVEQSQKQVEATKDRDRARGHTARTEKMRSARSEDDDEKEKQRSEEEVPVNITVIMLRTVKKRGGLHRPTKRANVRGEQGERKHL